MRLKSLRVSGGWQLEEFTLADQNLLVGVNASGKTTVISRIQLLAALVAGDAKPDVVPSNRNINFFANFEDQGTLLTYELKIAESRVVHEKFLRGTDVLMSREEGGTGTIRYLEKEENMEFQTPQTALAVVNREDSKQHPFFEPLSRWGKNLYCAYFGTDLDKRAVMIVGPTPASRSLSEPALRPSTQTVLLLQRGLLSPATDIFKKYIIEDMTRLGYFISDIGLRVAPELVPSIPDLKSNLVSFGPQANFSSGGTPIVIFIKERDLEQNTDQFAISQGMWRALVVVIYLSFMRISSTPSCMLIDDIGEGLDYDRSRVLIELLQERARDAHVQLIMSTNDRFVMNSVPLESWTVLRRSGSLVKTYNYSNSREVFEEFKDTGLNNFDFFRMDFVNPESRKDSLK